LTLFSVEKIEDLKRVLPRQRTEEEKPAQNGFPLQTFFSPNEFCST
jgi:hypothetical protein